MKENEIEVWGTTEAQDVSSNAVNSRGEKCRIVRTYDYYPDEHEIHEHVSIQNDYVIPVKNMGHNLKQVVRDNAAYGLAALITHRMLMLVAERLRQFEGKVYNV